MATGALVILAVIPPRTTPKTGGVQTDEEANLTSEDDTSRHPMDGGEATHNRKVFFLAATPPFHISMGILIGMSALLA
jgi:hypothetical protein